MQSLSTALKFEIFENLDICTLLALILNLPHWIQHLTWEFSGLLCVKVELVAIKEVYVGVRGNLGRERKRQRK